MRRIRSILAWSVIVIVAAGCATANKISKVKIGMTRAEVISNIGKPASVSAKGKMEYLNYSLSETGDHALYGITTPYYVRLIDGRVESYGRLGDFDSTKTPSIRVESDQRIQQDIRTNDSEDLYTELTKLKELKSNGTLTDSEYEEQKKKLLEKY